MVTPRWVQDECLAVLIGVIVGSSATAAAGGAQPAGPRSARDAAPIDLTGYWVSVVTQDWRWRMVTPAKGDFGSIPITLDAKKVADSWDPAKDEAAGEQCRSYGAPALMAVPTRLRIGWQDENTLEIETDAGTQTRLFRFGPSALREPQGRPEPGRGTTSSGPSRAASRASDSARLGSAATWQGESRAEWESPREARGARPGSGSLKVVTKRLRPGYLRRNGVPYSADAMLTEYWDLATESNGDRWVTLTSTVEDSRYLREPFVTVLQFKKEPDGGKWDPTPCSAR